MEKTDIDRDHRSGRLTKGHGSLGSKRPVHSSVSSRFPEDAQTREVVGRLQPRPHTTAWAKKTHHREAKIDIVCDPRTIPGEEKSSWHG